MPHSTKIFFYTFVIFQILLLHVTFTYSAVIRREQFITNETVLASSSASAEIEPATAIGLEDDGNLLLEMPLFKDDTTTKNSIENTVLTTSSVFGEEKKEDTTLTGLRLDENTVGLSSDNDRKSSKVVMIEKNENKREAEKSKNEESATVEMIVDKSTITKIEETTAITPSVIENERTTSKKEEEEGVSTFSTASHETLNSKKEEVSTVSSETSTSKKEEVSTISTSPLETSTSKIEEVFTASFETSTSKKEEVSTISTSPFETSTSKKEEQEVSTVSPETLTFEKEEEEGISTISAASIETSTQLKVDSLDHTNDKIKKEEKSIVENSVDLSEDTTQIKSTSFEETTNVSASNTNMDINETTEMPPTTTTIPVENDSATKSTQPSLTTNNYKLEEIDKVTEKLHVQNELVDTSTTDPAENDISKTLSVTNEQKANVIDEKKLVTTQSILLTKEKNMETQKMTDIKFTKPVEVDETTQFPLTSTEEFTEEHYITIKTINEEDLKNSTINDVKNSNSSSTEKRGKFIANNYSSFNDFHLPNTSDVWALASLRSVGKSKSSELQNSVETSEEKPSVNNSMGTKSLHDWTRVMETTHHNMESKPFMRIVENIEDPTTETDTSITATTNGGTEPYTTVKVINIATEIPIEQETTETSLNQDNKVEILTTKVKTEPTTVIPVNLKDKIERETIDDNPIESHSTNNDFETSTDIYENPVRKTTDEEKPSQMTDEIISTTTTVSLLDVLTNNEKTIEENKVDGDSFEKETISHLMTTTTTTTTTTETPMPQIVTVKSETTETLANGEITQETNAGTTSLSTSSLSDFTTSIPFLTSTAAITKKIMAVMTDVMTTSTPPVVILNTDDDDDVNEPPSSLSTVPSKIPTHTTSPVAVTIDSFATTTPPTTITTTTTKMPPAVTVIEEMIETQTTEVAPHTPAIISNETMIQKSNHNKNYNEYEVVNKSTENYADNSSTEAIEATTRVGLQSNWSTNAAAATEIPTTTTTEVDKLDEEDLDITTVSSFENNNAYDIESTITTTSTVIGTVTLAPKTYPIVTDTVTEISKTSTENLDHIDPIHKISETAETSIESNVIDPLHVGETSTAAAATTTTTTTTETNQENMKMPSTTTVESADDESIYSILTTTSRKISTTTTTSTPNYYDESAATTFESISTKKEDVYSIVPTMTIDNGGGYNVPKSVFDDTTTLMPPGDLGVGGGGGGLPPMDSPEAQETDVNVIIAISVSTVGIIALILLVAFLYVMRKRQKQMSYGQRCRPVSLDAYSLDNVSVYNSVRRKGATLRASKRSYGNVAFDDPSLRHNVLGTHELARYVEKKSSIWEEFKEVPQIIARADEVPAGCEDKNRYANVIPLPETRVILQQQNGDEKSEYINANYVRGPKDTTNYYIACQAPLETTVNDFWRMIWEQNSRVIIMATDLIENGIDKCAEYLPPSVTLDNHTVFGDYQVTLKHREVKEKYAISTLMLKNTVNDESREITHYWYRWPETGVPTDEAAIIAMLLEARSSLKAYTIEQCDGKIENSASEENSSAKIEINGNVTSEKSKPLTKDQGPLTIHCSPGTGRTGTILACDIAMRCLEEPKRTVDIPQIVYSVRRGRASAVQTKEQYEFIYKVTHMYATKISNINNDN